MGLWVLTNKILYFQSKILYKSGGSGEKVEKTNDTHYKGQDGPMTQIWVVGPFGVTDPRNEENHF